MLVFFIACAFSFLASLRLPNFGIPIDIIDQTTHRQIQKKNSLLFEQGGRSHAKCFLDTQDTPY